MGSLLSQRAYYKNFMHFMNQDGVVILELNLVQKQYDEEMKFDGFFYYYNQNNYIFDNDVQRVIFDKGQIKTINKIDKQIIWEDVMPNSFTVFDLFNGKNDFIELYDYKVLNHDVRIFFKIEDWSIFGSFITKIDTGEPKELEFGSEENMQTKIFIMSRETLREINLEKLDTETFDIVDLRE